MEEADILGDRIAIMHHGQIVSYGTSMFLKKAYGMYKGGIVLELNFNSNIISKSFELVRLSD